MRSRPYAREIRHITSRFRLPSPRPVPVFLVAFSAALFVFPRELLSSLPRFADGRPGGHNADGLGSKAPCRPRPSHTYSQRACVAIASLRAQSEQRSHVAHLQQSTIHEDATKNMTPQNPLPYSRKLPSHLCSAIAHCIYGILTQPSRLTRYGVHYDVHASIFTESLRYPYVCYEWRFWSKRTVAHCHLYGR